MRKSNWKSKALFFIWLILAAVIAYAIYLLMPVSLNQWKQTLFFVLWVVIGGIGAVLLGKRGGRR